MFVIAGLTTAGAQPNPIERTKVSVGAAVGASVNGDRNSGDGAPDFSVNADISIGDQWRVRSELGRVKWNFDESEGQLVPLPPEDVTLTRVSAALLYRPNPTSLGHPYFGGGIGIYHYGFELPPPTHRRRPGVHVVGGFEYFLLNGAMSIRLEAQIQAVDGPNANPVAGFTSGPSYAPPERVSSNTLFNIQAGIGFGWRLW